MKKKISIVLSVILLLGCMPLNAFAENVFNWIVEPSLVYDYVYGFEDGLSGVRVGGDELKRTWDDGTKFYNINYHGVVNLKGEEIIPVSPDNPTFAWGGNMEDGYVWKEEDGNTLVYNSDGELVFTIPYDNAYYWRDGLFIASTDEYIMLMDMEGNIKLSVQKLYDNYSIYKWGNFFWEVIQRSSDYSEYRYDLYNYDEECVLEDIDSISNIYASGNYDNYGSYYEASYIKENDKYALINDDAQILTGFDYDAMDMLDGGMIKVKQGEKYGLIDRQGYIIFPCEYDSIEKKIYDNKVYYMITDGDYQGLIRSNGDIIANPEYIFVYYRSGVFECGKEDEDNTDSLRPYDYINTDGDIIYSSDDGYSHNVSKVSDDYYTTPEGIIDKYGNVILYLDNIFYADLLDTNNILITCYDDVYYMYNTASGTIRELTKYSYYYGVANSGVMRISEGAYSDIKYGLVNINEKEVLPCEYDDIYMVANNTFLRVSKDGKWGIADYNGNILVPCEFDYLNAEYGWSSYYKYYIEGTKNDVTYYGYIDDNNKLIVPCEYDSVSKYENGYQVKKDGKYGIIGLDGDVILPCEYDEAWFTQDKYIKIKKNDKYGILNLNGNPCIAPLYDDISNGGVDLFVVKKNDKYGILDAHGNDIIPIEYNDIMFTNSGGGGSLSYSSGYKWCEISKDIDGDGVMEHGLADTSGNIFLDCEYSDIVISDDIIVVKDKDGLWGWGKYEYKMPVTISSEVNEGILEVSITNDEELTGTMVVAFYKDNALVTLEQSDITDANGSINFEIPNADIDYYKVFVWDGVGTMQPLSHTAQGELDVEYIEPEPTIEPTDEPVDTDEPKYGIDFRGVTKLNIDGVIYEVIGTKDDVLMDIDTISELTRYEYEWDSATQITFVKEGASFSFILNTYDVIQHGRLEEDWKLDEKFQQINGKYYLQFLEGPVSFDAYNGDYTSGDDTYYITLTN